MIDAVVTLHISIFFFFNATATTEIYTLSLHDALPISLFERNRTWDRRFGQSGTDETCRLRVAVGNAQEHRSGDDLGRLVDRKSTRLNSSHVEISYAVFCLKKKKKKAQHRNITSVTHIS